MSGLEVTKRTPDFTPGNKAGDGDKRGHYASEITKYVNVGFKTASWFDGRVVVSYLIICIVVLQCCMHGAAYIPSVHCRPGLHQQRLQKLSLFHPSAFPESRSAIKYQELCNWNSFAPDVAQREAIICMPEGNKATCPRYLLVHRATCLMYFLVSRAACPRSNLGSKASLCTN